MYDLRFLEHREGKTFQCSHFENGNGVNLHEKEKKVFKSFESEEKPHDHSAKVHSKKEKKGQRFTTHGNQEK